MRNFASHALATAARWPRLVVAGCVALCITFAYYMHLVPRQMLGFQERLSIALYLGVFFFALAYLLLRLVGRWLREYRRREQAFWVLGCLGAGAFLVVVIPLAPPTEPTRHTIQIVATGQKSAQAQSSEVWLYGIAQGDTLTVPFSAFAPADGWVARDDALLAVGPGPASARWEGTLEPGAELRFLAHPWSGIVEVRIDGVSQAVDLYSATQTTRSVPIPQETGTTPLPLLARNAALFIGDAVSLALLLLVAMLASVRFRGGRPATPHRWSWLVYALPCVAVWLLYLLAFWPGMMSPDSLDQWQQAQTSHFIDHHPAPHTMIIWLVTRLWPSPAAMALLQIVALAAVFGLTMQELARWGVPRWVRIACTILFCLAPVNGAMSITLWKDVLYSIAMLAVFSLVLRVVRTHGAWFQPWRNRIVFALLLAAVALFRHNGLPLAAFVLTAMFVLLALRRWQVGIVALIWALMYLTVRIGVYNLVGVEPMSRAFSLYYSVHQVAAFVHSGVPLSDQDKALLNGMQPLQRWGDDYTCYGGDPTFWAKGFNHAFLQAHAGEFTALWLRLAREHPDILLRHLFCVNSINWRIVPAPDSYMYVVQNGILPNSLGLEQHPLLPQLTSPLQQYLFWFHQTGQSWLWRPALYLYLTIAVTVVYALRRRNMGILLLASVSLGNIAVMMILTPAQDLRYQYGVVMIGLIAPVLLWATAEPRGASTTTSHTSVRAAATQRTLSGKNTSERAI